MKASRKARDRARKDHAAKFEQLQRQVEAQAVILDLLDEKEAIESKLGRAVDVLRSFGVKATEVEEVTGLTSLQQARYLKVWQEHESLEVANEEDGESAAESGTVVADEVKEESEVSESLDSFGLSSHKMAEV